MASSRVTESLYEDPELTEATTEAEPDEEAQEADEGGGEAVEILAFPYAETIRDGRGHLGATVLR
ncbi:hypothetical protein BH23ACT2_BH23ACT2_20900 [soil metagenome]